MWFVDCSCIASRARDDILLGVACGTPRLSGSGLGTSPLPARRGVVDREGKERGSEMVSFNTKGHP